MAFLTPMLQIIRYRLGAIRLTVVLCWLLALDLSWGYFSLNGRSPLFAPLNDIGLAAWITTYGRHNLIHTVWFYILLGLLALLCLNMFVCTTDRVAALLGRRSHLKTRRLFFKLAPHLMHYALILILAGYLSSYLFARVLDMRTLVPGSSLTLPGTKAKVTFTDFDPVYYRGKNLPAFKNRILQPRARLTINTGTRPDERILSLNRPMWVKGYGIFLKDFSPKSKASGMARRPRIDVSIRKDPGVKFYLAGIVLFTVGLGVYLAEWVFFIS